MTPVPLWSPLALRARPLGLGYTRGKLAEATVAPSAVVVHTTGAGPVRRATERRYAAWRGRWGIAEGDALQAAVVLYTRIMDASGHYVIGQDGTIVQVVPESHCAWHVGGSGSRAYFTRGSKALAGPRYAWWRARWPGYETPRDLGGGHLWDPYDRSPGLEVTVRSGLAIGSANANSIGIEVVPPTSHPLAPWSEAAWEALVTLTLDILGRHRIPLERDRVISHSDAHPLSRTTAAGVPWDPSSTQWSWERFHRIARTMLGAVEVVA